MLVWIIIIVLALSWSVGLVALGMFLHWYLQNRKVCDKYKSYIGKPVQYKDKYGVVYYGRIASVPLEPENKNGDLPSLNIRYLDEKAIVKTAYKVKPSPSNDSLKLDSYIFV